MVRQCDLRLMRWGLAVLLVTTPVTGFAQTSRTGAPLAPMKPSQIVVLQSQVTPCPVQGAAGLWLVDAQTLPDGRAVPFPGIPAGQVLVLTGLSYVAGRGDSPFNSTRIFLLNSSVPPPTSGPAAPFLFHSAVPADGFNWAGGTAALHNAVVKPGTVLCLGASDRFGITGVISGFFAKDE